MVAHKAVEGPNPAYVAFWKVLVSTFFVSPWGCVPTINLSWEGYETNKPRSYKSGVSMIYNVWRIKLVWA